MQCSIFALGQSEHCQLIAWIDRNSLFGHTRLSLLAPGLTHFPPRSGTTQVSRALALLLMYHHSSDLGLEIILGSPDATPVPLTPGGGGRDILIVRAMGE